MLNWLFPATCPCDPVAKQWIETRLQWLTDQFDHHAFNGRPLVLPTAKFFPDAYDESEESIRILFSRVCGYMDVNPEWVALELFTNENQLLLVNKAGQYLPQAAGTYEEAEDHFVVRIDTAELSNPVGLVGTMAHELSHLKLLGERRCDYDEYDNELLTDLTVVFLGLGIFLASSPRNWDSHYGKWPGTELNKPEYMTPPMYGYALAHLAWHQGETKPSWSKHLHFNARPDFNQAVRFLNKTGESNFKPQPASNGQKQNNPSPISDGAWVK